MLEHRKRARRKGRSSSDSTSISPCHAENCVGLITKYSAVLPSCIYNSGDVHNLNVKPTLGSSPPTLGSSPINHIVIDSDTDESNIDTECGDEDGDSGNGINTMRYNSEAIKLNPSSTSAEDGQHHELSQKGSRQRTEVLERDARRRIQELAGKYICPCCDYCASFPSKVKRHMANKHSDSHLCSKCNMRFDTFSMLRKHVSSEHPKVHHCEYCSFSHKIKAAVRRHTTANHENGVMCTVAGCNMRVSRWRLRAHIEKEHPCHQPLIASRVLRSEGCRTRTQTALLKCSHCNFDTNDLDDYNSHVMSAHEIGIECPMPDCSVRFLLGDMDSHFATLHGGSTFEDSFIDKNAASYTTTTTSECVSTSNCSGAPCSDLVDFIPPKIMGASRGNSGGLHCSLCGKDYRDFYLLRKHIKSVHERSYAKYFRPLKYSCNWPGCKKAFTTCGLLRDHVNTHRGLKPYRCANCESSFYARARFAVHLSKYHRISIRDYSRVSHLLKRPTLANDNEK